MTPPLYIRDIARPDTTTEFRSDVLLSTYNDNAALNQDLIQRFMFTQGSGGHSGRKGTADLLRLLRQGVSAIGSTEDNRFLFMATYGHGKSHFGLAVANYFGQPSSSSELETVLKKLAHVLPDDQAAQFRELRENKAAFLTLILQGTDPGSLRDNFFKALDAGLARHPQTKGLKLPFWFDKAQELLEALASNAEHAAAANSYLLGHHRDLPSLMQEVQEKKASAYALVVGAFKAVHRVEPHLGGETSLAAAINWVADELCGSAKPFGGLLVLFDEFSRFIQDYWHNNEKGAPLQDLLNGIAQQRGKALFVGLSQHDPNVIAEKYGGGEELIKELNRLPTSNRHVMQTMLEDVLSGILKTDREAWGRMLRERGVGGYVSEASDTAHQLFSDRYGPKQLGWSLTQFQEKVAMECFPLHPLTTAFLSSVNLQSSATVRSVLGFLTDEQGYVLPCLDSEAVLEGGRPNWILPIRLVDYFGEMLGEEKYKQYKNVYKSDLAEEQQAVLKAMLLLDISELPTKHAGGYAAVVANLAGLDEKRALQTLKTLEEQHYIRYDSANKTYSFWVGSNGALELDRLLKETIEQREANGSIGQLFDTFTGGTNPVNSLNLTGCHAVSVAWGHPDDWAADEVLVPVNALKPGVLAALRNKYAVPLDAAPQARGVVVLMVPRTDQEAKNVSERVRELLASSSTDLNAPMLFLTPKESYADLHTNLLKLALLSEARFKQAAQPKVGESVLTEMRESLESKVKKVLEKIRTESDLQAPPGIQSALVARNIPPRSVNRIGLALQQIYHLAYAKHPDKFFDQYKLNSPTMNKSTVDVIYELLDNTLDDVKWPAGAKVPKETVRILQSWGVVSPQLQVIEPQYSAVKAAWDRFDATFSPQAGRVYADQVLKELLQPPYGYDQNTLSLLFAAWIGRNRNAIKLGGVGRISRPLEGSKNAGFKKPADFLKAMSAVEISVKDMAGEKQKVEKLLASLRDGLLTQVQAKRGILALEEFKTNNARYDENYLEQIEATLGKLAQGLVNLEKYNEAVQTFDARLAKSRSVADLEPLFKQLGQLPALTVVTSEQATPDRLKEQLLEQTFKLATVQTQQLSDLKDLGRYALHEQALKQLVDGLRRLNLLDLKNAAEQAMQALAQRKAELENQQSETSEVSVVQNIPVSGSLQTLRGSLEALKKFDPKSNRAAALSEEKYTQIKAAIADLEGHLPGWQQALEAVDSHKAAQTLSKELLTQGSRYEHTPEAEQITQMQGRAEQLAAYFQALTPGSAPRTPTDAEERRAVLSGLAEQYQGVLTDSQLEHVGAALAALQAQVEKMEGLASAWLKEKQEQFTAGNTEKLERELDAPPAFLLEAQHSALSALRSALRSRVDEDTQERQLLERIAGLSVSGRLSALQQRLEQLAGLPLLPGKVSEAAQEKRQQLEAEIKRLEALPTAWQQGALTLLSAGDTSELMRDVTRQESRFEGTVHADGIRTLLAQLDATEKVFREAERLRAIKDTSLRGLQQRYAEQEVLRDTTGLSQVQREHLAQDAEQTHTLYKDRLDKLHRELETHASALAHARTLGELKKIDLSNFPRSGLPSALAARLHELGQLRVALDPLLSELAVLNGTQFRSEGEAHGALSRFDQLLEASIWSPQQLAAVEDGQNKVREKMAARAQEAAAWVEVRRERLASADAAGLTELGQQLDQPPAFLDARGSAALAELKHQLRTRLEQDQALYIETLFQQIHSSERRAALLQRLQALELTPSV